MTTSFCGFLSHHVTSSVRSYHCNARVTKPCQRESHKNWLALPYTFRLWATSFLCNLSIFSYSALAMEVRLLPELSHLLRKLRFLSRLFDSIMHCFRTDWESFENCHVGWLSRQLANTLHSSSWIHQSRIKVTLFSSFILIYRNIVRKGQSWNSRRKLSQRDIPQLTLKKKIELEFPMHLDWSHGGLLRTRAWGSDSKSEFSEHFSLLWNEIKPSENSLIHLSVKHTAMAAEGCRGQVATVPAWSQPRAWKIPFPRAVSIMHGFPMVHALVHTRK